MTPAAIVSLVKDALIIGAVIFLLWFTRHGGEQQVQLADYKALMQQIQTNAAQEQQWRDAQTKAQGDMLDEIDSARSAIGVNSRPVLLCSNPTRPGPVPSLSAPTVSIATRPVPTVQSAGEDLRPKLNAFELQLETIIAQCRGALAQWPQP